MWRRCGAVVTWTSHGCGRRARDRAQPTPRVCSLGLTSGRSAAARSAPAAAGTPRGEPAGGGDRRTRGRAVVALVRDDAGNGTGQQVGAGGAQPPARHRRRDVAGPAPSTAVAPERRSCGTQRHVPAPCTRVHRRWSVAPYLKVCGNRPRQACGSPLRRRAAEPGPPWRHAAPGPHDRGLCPGVVVNRPPGLRQRGGRNGDLVGWRSGAGPAGVALARAAHGALLTCRWVRGRVAVGCAARVAVGASVRGCWRRGAARCAARGRRRGGSPRSRSGGRRRAGRRR